MSGYELHDLFGNIGVLFILATYLLLQLQKLEATGLLYSLMNATGAAIRSLHRYFETSYL